MPEQPGVVADNQHRFSVIRQCANQIGPRKHQPEIIYIRRPGRGVGQRAGIRGTDIAGQCQPGIANTVKAGLKPSRQIG